MTLANPPRNSQPETDRTDEAAGGPARAAPALLPEERRVARTKTTRTILGAAHAGFACAVFDFTLLTRTFAVRPPPEYQTGKTIAQKHRPNHQHRYLHLVLHEVGQSLRAIADGQVADPEVADEPCDGDRRCKAVQRHLKNARGKHEEFERRRRRKNASPPFRAMKYSNTQPSTDPSVAMNA